MGNICKTTCLCGFNKTITIGGGRHDHLIDSRFPFYCKKCGLVEVNIRSQGLMCPQCKSADISEYGKSPISIQKDGHPAVQWANYSAHKTDNLCPKCNKMTLVFQSPHIFFD